jgi:hypothetical protein
MVHLKIIILISLNRKRRRTGSHGVTNSWRKYRTDQTLDYQNHHPPTLCTFDINYQLCQKYLLDLLNQGITPISERYTLWLISLSKF